MLFLEKSSSSKSECSLLGKSIWSSSGSQALTDSVISYDFSLLFSESTTQFKMDAVQHAMWCDAASLAKHGVFIQTTVFHLILHSGWNRFQSEHPTSSNRCESRADLSLEVYQGSWQNNCAHGLGTFVHTDGDTYRCEICETIRFHWSKKKGTSMTTKSHWLECWRCEATVIWFKTLIYFHVVCV